MTLQIINPITYPNWDDQLLSHPDYSFFHSSSWARVLSESYHYTPLYFTSFKNGKLETLVPLMEVNSIITGKRGISLPFTDYCEPIVPDQNSFKEVIERLIEYGKNARWKYMEWRGGEHHFQDISPSLSLYIHTLGLFQDGQKVFSCFKNTTKRNIKKAVRQGVEVQFHSSFESVKKFYRLNCMTRKKHGLPPQPFSFFKKIHEHIISKKRGFVALALSNKKIIAGSVFFHFGEKAIYKFGASNEKYLHVRPNNMILWESMRWCAQKGFKSFSFGITGMDNKGLLQFKRGWGAEESMINYYRYNVKKMEFIKDEFRGKTFYPIFQKMPSPILNLLGSIVYRHIA